MKSLSISTGARLLRCRRWRSSSWIRPLATAASSGNVGLPRRNCRKRMHSGERGRWLELPEMTVPVARASFSSIPDDGGFDRDGTSGFRATIESDGGAVAVRAPQNPSSSDARFAASWLWINDPRHIHPTSGQRLRTLADFRPAAHRIVEARILPDAVYNDHDETSLHPLSPPGSYHPRGGVYDDEILDGDQTNDETTEFSRILLEVDWADGTESQYDWDWLQRFSSPSSTNSSTTRISNDIAIGAASNPKAVSIPTLSYDHIMGSEEGKYEALHSIIEYGALLVQEAPIVWDERDDSTPADGTSTALIESDATVADLGKRLSGGRLSHGSLYGDTFRVQSKAGAENIAYTTVGLPPHQDLTYYESKPFLQLLHCVETPPDVGGASVLIDAMAAAERLREIAPSLFGVLTNVEATFVKQRPGADMVSFKPHIVTSNEASGEEVVAVNWSPPFEGPLLSLEGSAASESQPLEEDYVKAYQALECMLDDQSSLGSPSSSLLPSSLREELAAYASDFTWEYTLQPGELLVFNNQRMCHGRRAFSLPDDNPSVQRHLIGCYTDAMETINEYRLLQRRRLRSTSCHRMRNVGNGVRGSPF